MTAAWTCPAWACSARVSLGPELSLAGATRLSRWQFQARHSRTLSRGPDLRRRRCGPPAPRYRCGLNLGLLDAVNLAWKLAAGVGGWAPTGLLDTYHAERHVAWARALMQTQAQVALRRGQDAAAEALRDLFSELCTDEQPLRRLGAAVAGTDIRYEPPNPASTP